MALFCVAYVTIGSGCKKLGYDTKLPPREIIIQFCWQTFDKALKDKNDFVKSGTMLTLARIGNAKAIQTLQAVESTDRPAVVKKYVHVLSQLQDSAAFAPLYRYTSSTDFQVRETVILGLAKMRNLYGDTAMARIFRKAMLDVDSIKADTLLYDSSDIAREKKELRAKIAVAQLTVRDGSGLKLVQSAIRDSIRQLRLGVTKFIGELLPPNSMSFLSVTSNDASDYIRSKTAEALGKISSNEANALLKKMLNDKAEDVRVSAAIALMKADELLAVEHLMPSVEGVDDDLRSKVILALGEVKLENSRDKAISIIKKCATDPSEWVRVAAIGSLGILGDTTSVGLLKDALSDDSPSVREIAVGVLSKLKGKDMLEILLQLLRDKEYSTRSVAISNLGWIEDSNLEQKVILPAIYDRMRNDEDMMVRVRAAFTLLDVLNDRKFTKKSQKNLL